jgi:alcohol dehydrogenase class IV
MVEAIRFDFAGPARILFGAGAVREVAAAARAMGARALLVLGAPLTLDIPGPVFHVEGEPTIDLVRRAVALAREERCEVVVGVGGGSAIDAGKAVAALIANGGDPLDYLEVIGAGKRLERPSAPFIAVPTTAGTGAEATRNAVLVSPEHGVKASLRSSHMLPRLAVVDPELTFDLPPALTASTGMDALTQLIEPYVSVRANALVDLFCADGMRRASRSIERAFTHDRDAAARADMSMASLLGGLSLANAGLGAVHGFAAPVGGSFHAPHGAVCAALLPHVMEVNIAALRARAPESPAIERYAAVARILTGDPAATAESGAAWTARLSRALAIPALGAYGVQPRNVPELVAKAARASSMKGNPIALTEAELTDALTRAL